jgi:hypothetical protein
MAAALPALMAAVAAVAAVVASMVAAVVAIAAASCRLWNLLGKLLRFIQQWLLRCRL